MRNLGNHRRGNPVADLVCYFFGRSKGDFMKELLKQYFKLWCKERWLKAIDKQINKYDHLRQKMDRQYYVLSEMINRYNEIYGDDLTLGGKP